MRLVSVAGITSLTFTSFIPFSLSLTVINLGFFSQILVINVFVAVSYDTAQAFSLLIYHVALPPFRFLNVSMFSPCLKIFGTKNFCGCFVSPFCHNTLCKASISHCGNFTGVPFLYLDLRSSRIFVVNANESIEEKTLLTGPGSLKSKKIPNDQIFHDYLSHVRQEFVLAAFLSMAANTQRPYQSHYRRNHIPRLCLLILSLVLSSVFCLSLVGVLLAKTVTRKMSSGSDAYSLKMN